MTTRPAIFLDRDGVIIEDVHYLGSPDGIRLIPGSAAAIAALNRAGWPVVVVTNQAGVGRGYFPESAVGAVHARLSELLVVHGARVDGYYFCPHHPAAELADYRRELRTAAADHGLDLARSWLVGDRETDLQAGAAVGARTVLVRTGYGSATADGALDHPALNLELIADNLADAVQRCGWAEAKPAA